MLPFGEPTSNDRCCNSLSSTTLCNTRTSESIHMKDTIWGEEKADFRRRYWRATKGRTIEESCVFPSRVPSGGKGCWASRALARAGCACPSILVWSRRRLLKWLSLSAWQTPLWFPECTTWIPFRWNSNQRMHSRSALNALGLLLGVAPVEAKPSEPPARTRSHYRHSASVLNDLPMQMEPQIKEHPWKDIRNRTGLPQNPTALTSRVSEPYSNKNRRATNLANKSHMQYSWKNKQMLKMKVITWNGLPPKCQESKFLSC